MKRQRTYQAFSKATAFFLVLMVTFASSGISYAVHYCHGTLTSISVLPEILPSGVSCECDKNAPQKHSDEPDGIGRLSCCSNLFFYQKINLLSFNNPVKISPIPVSFSVPLSETGLFRNFSLPYSDPIPENDHYHIPIQGRSLILFLHQIRIPAITGDC